MSARALGEPLNSKCGPNFPLPLTLCHFFVFAFGRSQTTPLIFTFLSLTFLWLFKGVPKPQEEHRARTFSSEDYALIFVLFFSLRPAPGIRINKFKPRLI